MKSDQPHSEEPLDRALPGFVGIDEWLPDGEGLLVSTMSAHSRLDIWRLSTQPGTEPVPVLATPANEHTPDVSADGEWFTYVSDTTGRDEVYVRRIDGEGGTWRVSSDGGTAPVWRKDGRELFYIDLSERLNAVSTTLGSSFSFRPAEPLFTAGLDEGTGGRQYDVSADGQRFLLNRGAKPATNPIVVVHGLAKEIERLLEEPSS